MTIELAFVGDVHGNIHALRGIWDELQYRKVEHTVFLGDYINKGPNSREVLTFLQMQHEAGLATLLAGNHDHALLDALERRDLADFLKIGGAATIRSYVEGKVGPDVLADFRDAFPDDHLDLLRAMPLVYAASDVAAQHLPSSEARGFEVSAHSPVGPRPRIGTRFAQIDTGCGSSDAGRLTAFLWPTRNFIQVDAHGAPVDG